jgi:N-acetylmuramoyl-L-alanine amidase
VPMRGIWTVWMLFFTSVATAGTVNIGSVRVWPAPDNTRVVFEVSDAAQYNLFTLRNPQRVVIDIKHGRLAKSVHPRQITGGVLKDIRTARHAGDVLRVVLDLDQKANPKSFILQPNQEYGHRLVVDLEIASRGEPVRTLKDNHGPRPVIIAIDPGHGGEDPGAHGPHGVKEKDVVLAIARLLKGLVEEQPGMTAVLTRDGDYYLSLRERIKRARADKADLFVSIHADAFRDGRVSGSSVYALSQNGASDEAARWLAEKENDSDLIGGVSLDDKDDLLASVLLDLSQTATIEASLDVGSSVLKSLDRIGKLHKHKVQQAGFVVLKSPDIPSILVETAYISNPRDEAHLRSVKYQRRIATGILAGIKDYFNRRPPAGTLLAIYTPRTHVITQGDTLFGIAQRYQVSVHTLRSVNHLVGKPDLQVGQTLEIPVTDGS